jgi:hypothetical protein
MKTASPEAWEVMISQYTTDATLVYMETDDSVYSHLRELAFQINLLKSRE